MESLPWPRRQLIDLELVGELPSGLDGAGRKEVCEWLVGR